MATTSDMADGHTVTCQGAVYPWQCDTLGHMNIQHYFGFISDGMFALQTRLGLGPTAMREERRSFAVVNLETDFRAELTAGHPVRLETRVEEIGNRTATFRHRLVRVEDGAVAMETRFTCVLFDLDARKAVPIPEALRGKLEALQVASTT